MREYFLLYNSVSIILGISATFVVLILYFKTRNPRLLAYLASDILVAAIVLAVTIDLYYEITGQSTVFRTFVWNSITFFSCGLCFFIPRMCRNERSTRLAVIIERSFGAGAIILGLLLIAHYLFSPNGNRMFLVLYLLIYMELSLACAYFGIRMLLNRKDRFSSRKLRHYQVAMRFTGWVILLLLPFFLITDFFGWLLPAVAPYLNRNFSLLPAFYIFMSLGALFSSALEILEPPLTLEALEPEGDFVRKYSLTRREAEIAPLVLQCLSYKEIGERLFISPGTVRTHLTHIYGKTGTKNRLELSSLLQVEQKKKAV